MTEPAKSASTTRLPTDEHFDVTRRPFKVSYVQNTLEHDSKMLESLGVDVDLLGRPRQEAWLEMDGADPGFANALRRVLTEELPGVPALTSPGPDEKIDAFVSDDAFLLRAIVMSVLENLVVEFNIPDDATGVLEIINPGPGIMQVPASAIVMTSRGKTLNWTPYPSSIVCELHANRSLLITDIKVVRGRSVANQNRWTGPAYTTYDILDQEPYDAVKQTGTPSTMCLPQQFKVGFVTKSNVASKAMFKIAVDDLIARLERTKAAVARWQADPTYSTDLFSVEIVDEGTRFILVGEYNTLPGMMALSTYLGYFDKFPNGQMPFTVAGMEHPKVDVGTLTVSNSVNTNASPAAMTAGDLVNLGIDRSLKMFAKVLLILA